MPLQVEWKEWTFHQWSLSHYRLRPWKWKQPVIPVAALAAGSRPDPGVDVGVACACTCREGKVDGRDLDARGSRVPEASRSATRTAEANKTDHDQRLYTVVKLSLALSLAILSFLPRSFPLASSCLSSSLRVARLIFFFGSPRALTHVRVRVHVLVDEISRKLE